MLCVVESDWPTSWSRAVGMSSTYEYNLVLFIFPAVRQVNAYTRISKCTTVRYSEILTRTVVFYVDCHLEDDRNRSKHVAVLPLVYSSLLNPT